MIDINDLLQRIDLRALAEAAGAQFRQLGNSSHCPIHGGNNPTAFHIYRGSDGRQKWHCFTGCKITGDAIRFYQLWKHTDFATTLRELEQWAGAAPHPTPDRPTPPPVPERTAPPPIWQQRSQEFLRFTQDELWNNDPALAYLRRRGISTNSISAWGLGYNPRDIWDDESHYGIPNGKRVWLPQGIVIPGWRNDGLYYVKIRRPFGDDFAAVGLAPQGAPSLPHIKYSSVRGSIVTLYGEPLLRQRSAIAIALVEGEFDAILLRQECGDLADVLTLGGAAGKFTTDDLFLLARYPHIIAAHDNDQAGERARIALAELSPRVIQCPPDSGKDITDLWRAHGGDGLRHWLTAALSQPPAQAPHPPAQAPHPVIIIERYDLNDPAAGWQPLGAA